MKNMNVIKWEEYLPYEIIGKIYSLYFDLGDGKIAYPIFVSKLKELGFDFHPRLRKADDFAIEDEAIAFNKRKIDNNYIVSDIDSYTLSDGIVEINPSDKLSGLVACYMLGDKRAKLVLYYTLKLYFNHIYNASMYKDYDEYFNEKLIEISSKLHSRKR